jgi:hypothetical protein
MRSSRRVKLCLSWLKIMVHYIKNSNCCPLTNKKKSDNPSLDWERANLDKEINIDYIVYMHTFRSKHK